MTSKEALEKICDKCQDTNKCYKCCDEFNLIKKELEVLKILKPRIHLKNGKLKGSYFTIDKNNDLAVSKDDKEIDVVFVEATGFVFSEEEKILKEWLEYDKR